MDLWWTTLLGGSVAPDLDAFQRAGTEARAILADVAATGRDGLLPRLARDGGLGIEEVLEQALLMLMAGHEPATNLVSNTVLALVTWPEQLRRLRTDPALLPNAIAESLRFDSPIQLSRRYAVEDLRIGDVTVSAGDTIILAAGSANRDPARWGTAAARFDIQRADAHQHVAFGRGAHHCLGAGMAQEVALVAVRALVTEFADLGLAAAPARNGRVNVRGLSGLRLSVQR